nr:hypothetical protein [Tanacetum cinerariifolium]
LDQLHYFHCKDPLEEGERVNDVLASDVDINLEKDLAGFALQAANISTHTPEPSRHFNSFCYDDNDDDDYKESTNPLNEIISHIAPSSVIATSPPVLPIEDPKDSIIMGNKDLSTIP